MLTSDDTSSSPSPPSKFPSSCSLYILLPIRISSSLTPNNSLNSSHNSALNTPIPSSNMESSVDTTSTFNYNSSSSTSPSPTSSPPPPPIVISPCAACKILRRRCVDKCVLAPYFPPTEPLKFTTAHRVFGASNIIKFLQELPESQRADAVSSMVYEANARIRDPVYGCAGAICQLQKQVNELQAELARAQAELVNMQAQHANLVAVICMEMANSQQQQYCALPLANSMESSPHGFLDTDSFLFDDYYQGSLWEEPLWT